MSIRNEFQQKNKSFNNLNIGLFNYRVIIPWLFLLPIIILSFLVIIGPSFATVFYSFTDWSGFDKPVYIGIDNFISIGRDPLFKIAIVNNFKWMVYTITVPMFMGLIGAWFVSMVRNRFIQIGYRLIYFLPYVLASVVVAGIWLNLYNPLSGIGAIIASNTKFDWANISFLGDKKILIWSIAFVGGWQQWGFNLVVLLAAMQNVDPELYEMAELEGANKYNQLIHVTIPSIIPTLVFLFLISAMFSLTIFDYVYLMTRKGGPGNSAYTLSTLAYDNAFNFFKMGYGIAIGITTAIFGVVFIIFYIYLRKRGMEV